MLDEGFPANCQSEASAIGFLHEVYHNATKSVKNFKIKLPKQL